MRSGVAAQQRVQLTVGTRRVLRAFLWFWAVSISAGTPRSHPPAGTPAKYARAARTALGAGKIMLASNELFAMYFRVVYVLEKGKLQ